MRISRLFCLLIGLLLGGCSVGGNDRPPPRQSGATAASVPPPSDRETRACFADLDRDRIRFSPILDQDYGGGCAITGAVQLIDIGVPVSGLKGMRCGLARAFTGWARNAVAPAARQILGSDLVRIESYGSYACRNVVGNRASAGRRSGHAIANAVDIAGFVLADGRRVRVEGGWQSGDPQERRFWETVHQSACKRFGTVLSPDYNAAHYNHLHLEDDHAGFCR